MAKHKSVTLALQGGGSHGAFTWGVLDRLLEEERLTIEGISGTSAGAINAAVLADGCMAGGREGARAALAELWTRVSEVSKLSPMRPSLFDELKGNNGVDYSSAYQAFSALGLFLSPYQFNPLQINPLRDIIEASIDFDRLRSSKSIKLFIAATQVRTGKLRIFENHELSTEVLLASACLPGLHHAVEIEGEPYWDGAFSANPALSPLIHGCDSRDIIIVLLSALQHCPDPKTAKEIRSRGAELAFTTAFLREMREIAEVKRRYRRRSVALGGLDRRIRKLNIHLIETNGLMKSLSHTSKLNTQMDFLEMLQGEGRRRANDWLQSNFEHIGNRSSVDLDALFH